jgi:hypothetical protein
LRGVDSEPMAPDDIERKHMNAGAAAAVLIIIVAAFIVHRRRK